MKKKKTIYQRLNKKEQKHIRDYYDGPPSRITLKRIRAAVLHNPPCWECNAIARKLGIEV